MTHEELLKEIEEHNDSCSVVDTLAVALRSVAELHKPEIISGCGSDKCLHCKKDGERYPCETIRLIEKELK